MNDPIQQLQAAVRRVVAAYAADRSAGEIVITDADGKRLFTLPIPQGAAVAESGPSPGWDFSRTIARFDGIEIPIYGKPLDLLKLLAAATGPMKLTELFVAWPNYTPAESTVRGHLEELRAKLKALFPLWEEQVTFTPKAGYELAIR
jgi:hypothetical protein